MANYQFKGVPIPNMVLPGGPIYHKSPGYDGINNGLNFNYYYTGSHLQRMPQYPYLFNGGDTIPANVHVPYDVREGGNFTIDVGIPTWANHYQLNMFSQIGAPGNTGDPGSNAHANNCPMGQKKRPRSGGIGGPGGIGGNAGGYYTNYPIGFSASRTNNTVRLVASANSTIAYPNGGTQEHITLNSGAQGAQGVRGNDGGGGCQSGPGNQGAPGAPGDFGSYSSNLVNDGTRYDAGYRTNSRIETYFFRL